MTAEVVPRQAAERPSARKSALACEPTGTAMGVPLGAVKVTLIATPRFIRCDLRATAIAVDGRYAAGYRPPAVLVVAGRNGIKVGQPIWEDGGGAVQEAKVTFAPGGLYGDHRCREFWSAHCLSLYPHFSLPQRHLRMTAGSIAAPSRTAPANGAVATTIARATRAHHRRRAVG